MRYFRTGGRARRSHSDTDRSGVTDFQDIVNVLSDWGECGE